MSVLPGASLLAAAVEYALNASFSGSSAAQRDLAALDGKVIVLEIKEFPLKLHFLPEPGRLTVAADYHGKADITVRAPTLSLLRAGLKRDGSVPRGMEISGDAETAQTFSRLLKQADLDWEELLSRYTGDLAAHQIGRMARGFLAWGRDAGGRLGRDLPPRPEVDKFLHGVDRLRDDAERFAARLERVAAKARLA